jgi:hypothetical protein
MQVHISMRAAEAVVLFERLASDAKAADSRDGAFSVEIPAEANVGDGQFTLIFNNDDMERPEMDGRILFEAEL